ncbi:hypothetical protein KAI65_03455 [Candidatus Parcubacteria bacterium]|nr:hypothetical protein [Candidatus Parcubacteria bacterium]
MAKNNLEQFSEILDKKLGENNKTLFKKIDEKIDKLEENIMTATKKGFDEVDCRFEKVEKEITEVKQNVDKIKDVQENIYQRICDQTDNEIKDLQLDMDKIKYIHKKEWNKLPPTYEISKVLAENGLKKSIKSKQY